MALWTPDDLRALQTRVMSAANTVNPAVIGCVKLSQVQQTAWALQFQLCTDYAAQDISWFSTGSVADEGQALLSQVESWRDAANKACPGVLPVNLDPNPPTPGSTISGLTSLAYAATALVAVVVIGKAVAK